MNENHTLLIVDDNPEIVTLLCSFLRRTGYNVLVATDGLAALEQVETHNPDLILLDIKLPDMDGFEVATRLKALPASQHIPIIFMTAVSEAASITKGFATGGVDYLVKPLRLEEALARIHTHLALHTTQRRLEERTRELTSLLELSRSMTSTLDLEHLANMIVDQLKTVADYTGCFLLTISDGELRVLAYRGPTPPEEIYQAHLSDLILRQNEDLFASRRALVFHDLHTNAQMLTLLQRYFGERAHTLLSYTHAWMCVPLVVNYETIGWLSLSHGQPGFYTDRHVELTSAFANHAAVAIKNARLYEQARQAAIHEERNRLARTLHDSVSQSLFSASLIAEVLPQIWKRDANAAQRGLAELLQLTQGALTEMRTLLLELRPATLLKTRLDDLLRQLAHATSHQTLVQINLDLDPIPELLPEVHVTFYRVAQEALNNIARHALAHNVTVALHRVPSEYLVLVIDDDGRGFDPRTLPPGRLGLEIMHERAKEIAARLTITSQPGQGTHITLIWPESSHEII